MLQGACKAKNGTRKDLFMAVPLASNNTLQKTKDRHYSNKNLTGYCKIVLSMYFTIPFIMRRSLKMAALAEFPNRLSLCPFRFIFLRDCPSVHPMEE